MYKTTKFMKLQTEAPCNFQLRLYIAFQIKWHMCTNMGTVIHVHAIQAFSEPWE